MTKRPEFPEEAAKAKGKKYIIMSSKDKIDYSTDDLKEALLAFAAVVAREGIQRGLDGKDDVSVVAIPAGLAGKITPSGTGIVAFVPRQPVTDNETLGIGYGITIEEWNKYGPDSLKGRVDDEDTDYRVVRQDGAEGFTGSDREEAFRAFARTAVEATRRYGYGPGSPVAIEFRPVPDKAIDAYPGKDRMKKRAIVVASISGYPILLAALEGVSYDEWEPVAEKYLGEALGGESMVLKTKDVGNVQAPILRDEKAGIEELGARYCVVDTSNVQRIKTDDEYEALLTFYECIEKEGGAQVVDGPTWMDTRLPTILGLTKGGNVLLVGMNKRSHDNLLEPQAITRESEARKSPWNATLH